MNFKDMATVGSGEIRKLGRLDGNKRDGSYFDTFQVNCWKTLERNQTLHSCLIKSNKVLFVSACLAHFKNGIKTAKEKCRNYKICINTCTCGKMCDR